jgi:HSP20 family protein
MDYIKIRFGDSSDNLDQEFERSFDGLFRAMNPVFALSEGRWKPAMDLYETGDELIVLAELAGVEEEGLEIEVSRKAIKISGRRAASPCAAEGSYHLAEIRSGAFERVLLLPSAVDPEVAAASASRGLLTIRLAKRAKEKPRQIPISGV